MNFADAVDQLKTTCRRALDAAVVEFHKETGVEPSGIDVEMAEVTGFKDTHHRYKVADVRLSFREY